MSKREVIPVNKNYDLLLHTCCGPCAESPARLFLREEVNFLGYYYNPNIQPPVEYARRLENLRRLAAILGFPLISEGESQPKRWTEYAGEQESRCRMCYRVRLEAAARKAAQLRIPRFTTTLLISPWQDHEAIRQIGLQAAASYQVEFLYRDFRPLYREGQDLACQDGLYRQKYCGCLPSIDNSRFSEKIRRDLAALEASPTASGSDRR